MLLGFNKQFGPRILDGSKIFTIRDKRKVTPKVGETIYMYSGLRTKWVMPISKDHKYTGSQIVRITIERLNPDGFFLSIAVYDNEGDVLIRSLHESQRSAFVKYDGFDSQRDFCEYWWKQEKRNACVKSNACISVTKTIYHWTDFRY
jgi:hypothetical protein